MIIEKLNLINEDTSPLFRLMWIYNVDEPTKRQFKNNISAFHIGKGVILSAAHNLRAEANAFNSIDEPSFQAEIIANVAPNLKQLFNNSYLFDASTNKRYINQINATDIRSLINELKRINYDTRWVTLTQRNICKPFLIVQFRTNQFYANPALTALFNGNRYFFEPLLNRHTFLIEIELVNSFYSNDIAMYRIVNTDQNIVNRLPSISPNFTLFDSNIENFCCLQSAPVNNLGRLLNEAKIEGLLDHWNIFVDRIGGDYIMDGTRYLIKGYFRFGSSGAPYVVYDKETNGFKVNAIQSEASGIQLSINNNLDGNLQYINAIASPLYNIREEIEKAICS